MVKGPGLYTDIGKRARGSLPFNSLFSLLKYHIHRCVYICVCVIQLERIVNVAVIGFTFTDLNLFFFYEDLLYRDYQADHKFTITTYSPTGVVSYLFVFRLFRSA